ncbi:hypothetical protein WKI65_43340 [Streptomyces sp. MS1.AVA.3]|uniref:hypothetical protein n=1 Tax=Streptomyces decoyicus TaxID=249567 RepID=UPI0030BBFE50
MGPGWEAIRISRYYGLQVLSRLRAPGAVIINPAPPFVYLFVAPGSTATWPTPPPGQVLVLAAEVTLPPARRRTPPGMYWLLPPRKRSMGLTNSEGLRAVLADVLPHWTEAT